LSSCSLNKNANKNFYRAASSLSHWVLPKGGEFETTFSRLKSAWGKAVKEKSKGTGNWVALWVEGDKILEFSGLRSSTQRLRMDDLKSCIQGLVDNLQASIKSLFPQGMDLPSSCVHKFLDQPTGEEFFMDTQHSKKILNPLYMRFEHGHRNILTSLGLVTAWLEKAEHFLCLLLGTLLVSGGRTPKMDAIGGCQIRGPNRNILHILGSPVWADHLSAELQSYPLQVAWPLYLYIGIIRPFTFKILTARGALSDLEKLQTNLFVHISPLSTEERRWTRGDTNTIVEQLFGKPLGLRLNHNDLQHILWYTINEHILPRVHTLSQPSQETYNTMANHTDLTASKYYAIDDLSNSTVDRFQTTHLLAVSREFHIWSGLAPTNTNPQPNQTPSFTLNNIYIQGARQFTSLAVAKKYQFNLADGVALHYRVEEVISFWKSTWFTLEERVEGFPSHEDQVLTEVLATLLLEVKTTDNSRVGSSHSLGEELVITALTLVSNNLHCISSL
jgi:hypothetical protein